MTPDGMDRLCASDPGRRRDHFHRPARRIRSDRGGQSRRGARPRKRHDSVFAVGRLAQPADQFVRQRSSAGAAALCEHGPVARPAAGRRCALSHQQCDIAEAGFCAAGLRNAPWRPARPDERLCRRQCARPLARGGAAAHRRRMPPATRDAVIAVASTLGVLVPPSLVLILLSDAMLNAHTLAVTATGRTDRVINTQDIFHAALLPAAIFLLLCFALCWFAGRSATKLPPREKLTAKQGLLAGFALVALLVLLGGVATGYFYAVEAAAMGAFTLLSAGLISGRLHGAVLRELLHDAIAITGALFSLLIAATTFTLILRLLGTDRLVDNLVAGIPGGDVLATAVILGVIGPCAFVLDAFEIIFVIVPIVIPPLLVRVADARWVAVLVLLTLQSSFL